MTTDERTCEKCGRLLADDDNVTLGSYARMVPWIHVGLTGKFPATITVPLPYPLEFCSEQHAADWLAQAVDEKLCRDNDDRLAQAEADAAERARDAAAELVDERCTGAYQTAAVPA